MHCSFQGGGSNTLQLTNVTVNGNIGVGHTGRMADSGPSTINGRVDFAAANIGQFKNNNRSNTITGGVSFSVADMANGLNWVNSLSQALYNTAGTSIAINSNVGGGNYTTFTGGSSLDINNNGDENGTAQGIFLDPNGGISVVNAVVLGRIFGGDSHDFQYVSGSLISAPSPPSVPDNGTTIVLFGIALVGIAGMREFLRARTERVMSSSTNL